MKLLVQRGERLTAPLLGSPRPTFTLRIRAELLDDEEALLRKYQIGNALLYEGDRQENLAITFGVTVLAFFLSLIAAQLLALSFLSATTFGLLCAGTSFLIVYERIRDDIYIDDIIAGKTFICPSVVDLMEKEELIEDVCLDFRQLLEDMTSWEGEEVVDVVATRARPRS